MNNRLASRTDLLLWSISTEIRNVMPSRHPNSMIVMIKAAESLLYKTSIDSLMDLFHRHCSRRSLLIPVVQYISILGYVGSLERENFVILKKYVFERMK